MFHRLWTLIRKELQSLLREPQTRAILIMPVLIQVLLFPFAATLEVTNATIAIYNEDNGKHAVELTQRFARATQAKLTNQSIDDVFQTGLHEFISEFISENNQLGAAISEQYLT
jgi:hypothetical protein